MAIDLDEAPKTEETENTDGIKDPVEGADKILYPDKVEGEDKEASNDDGNAEGDVNQQEDKKEDTEADKEKTDKLADSVPEPVKAEDLKFPEGVQVDEASQEKLLSIVNDNDMSSIEKTQALVDLQVGINAAQIEAHNEQVTQWETEVAADKEIIGTTGDKLAANLAIAKKGMEALKVEGLSDFLKQTGFGSHPLIVKAFYRVGNSISEDSFRSGGVGGKADPKETKDVLYANQDKL